jgi:hypothetical protein
MLTPFEDAPWRVWDESDGWALLVEGEVMAERE